MAISADLGDKLEAVVSDLVANGRYASKSEVLREGGVSVDISVPLLYQSSD